MEKFFEINKDGQNIRCKLYYKKGEPSKKVVMYCHGFAGHKDNRTAARFAERFLTKYKHIALLTFDLPCHGNDVKKKMVLQDCFLYMELVIGYIREELGAEEIDSLSASFGGYLVLKYISGHGNPFRKIVLRSPAVNMAESLTRSVLRADEAEILAKGKPVKAGFDRKIEITKSFVDDLYQNDICRVSFLDFADDILILHGEKDEIVSPETVRRFAEDNVIEYRSFENADHRFQHPDEMEKALKATIDFFEF